jgi:Na+-translocating ferredoxin:NAD+ oxidoreductase RnfD subunit
MYQLFTFFMVTDPKTTVKSRRGQYLVVFLVAAMECVLRLCRVVHAPYFALFLVGPAANFVEIMMTSKGCCGREAPRASATAPVATAR